MIKFTATDNGVIFSVRVQPRASRSCVAGEVEGTLRIRLAAAPVDGEANEELLNFLAKLLDIPRRQLEIVSGQRSKNKVLRISGITGERLEKIVDS
ncbi:MAG: YggU family protein [Blastocatellia bacterium]|nr:YggU family protein [Blastocatellia bacterium]